MDDPACPRAEVARALRFLAWLNRAGGATRVLRSLGTGDRVLDVATGGGDVPLYLQRVGSARTAVGLDLGRAALQHAVSLSPEVMFVRGNARSLPFADGSFDVAMCHMFFHHLTPDEIVHVLRELARVGRRIVVLDLARSRAMWIAVWLLTRFSGSRLARHDGPVSVRRAYTVSEIEAMAGRAGVPSVVRAGPWGRWCLVGKGKTAQA